jgi:hypothetical protein
VQIRLQSITGKRFAARGRRILAQNRVIVAASRRLTAYRIVAILGD